MSTLKTHNLQSPDAGSVNIAMTPNAGMIVAGLSTYSNQINVGSNIKLGTAGIVTATTFVGNLTGDPTGSGANLTNIPAGNLTGTVADARISSLTASKLTGALPAIDGSNLLSLPAGLGTALSQTQTSPLNKIYFTDNILSIGATVTIDPPPSAVVAYTNYSDIKITGTADLIIKDGDEFIPDILGLSTTSLRGRYTYN